MTTEWAIVTKGLYKSFGENEVLRDCSLAVEQGTIYGFLGINGAGKTTMFKILTGLLTPTMGEVHVLERCTFRHSLHCELALASSKIWL